MSSNVGYKLKDVGIGNNSSTVKHIKGNALWCRGAETNLKR